MSFSFPITNQNHKKLIKFLDDFKVETGDPTHNFNNQETGTLYCVPTDEWKPDIDCEDATINTRIDYLFYLVNKCYLDGIVLTLCERQYYTRNLPNKEIDIKAEVGTENCDLKEPEAETEQADENDDYYDLLGGEAVPFVPDPSIKKAIDELADAPMVFKNLQEKVDASCMEWDFDVFQKTEKRIFDESRFRELVKMMSMEITAVLDFTTTSNTKCLVEEPEGKFFYFHVAIMCKPAPVECKDNKKIEAYGPCYKESFRVRVYLSVTKPVKKFIRARILESEWFKAMFSPGKGFLNSYEDILDKGTISNAIMLLGSVARNKSKNTISDLYRVYRVRASAREESNFVDIPEVVTEIGKFHQEGTMEVKNPADGRKKLIKPLPPIIRGNLPHELSVCYETPYGVIKKPTVAYKIKFANSIQLLTEVNDDSKTLHDITDIEYRIAQMEKENQEVKYYHSLIMCLNKSKARDYLTWRNIVIALSGINKEYFPLAVKFSMRCPEQFNKPDAMRELEKLWNSVNRSLIREEQRIKSLSMLRSWAKRDDPSGFKRAQQNDVLCKLFNSAFKYGGRLNDKTYACLLYDIYNDIIRTSSEPHSKSSNNKVWYTFTLPGDETAPGEEVSLYKWIKLTDRPKILYRHITEQFEVAIRQVISMVDDIASNIDKIERAQDVKFYGNMKKSLNNEIYLLGTTGKMQSILRMSEQEFFRHGFTDVLDNPELNKDIIGVMNGVLKIYPKIELVSGFHDYFISRSVNCAYEPWNPKNDLHIEVEKSIDDLIDEPDARLFIKILLASSLSGRSKTPTRLILFLGEGSNGKSYIIELHSNMMRVVMGNGNGGYSTKLGTAFLTEKSKASGPDSSLMTMEFARMVYFSEGDANMIIRMEKIKELTDKITGSEKFERQKVFKVNSDVIGATNYDPKIPGRDHGTWRRFVAYRFKKTLTTNPDPNDPNQIKEDPTLLNAKAHDRNWQTAYLAMLTKYLQIFYEKYDGDMAKVILDCPTIRRETEEYRSSQDYVYRFYTSTLIKVEEADPISFDSVKERFIQWCKLNQIRDFNMDTDTTYMRKMLNKNIKTQGNTEILYGYKMLATGEIYNPTKNDTVFDVDDLEEL